VTSLSRELDREVPLIEVEEKIVESFLQTFR
jgi:hypothetical protein